MKDNFIKEWDMKFNIGDRVICNNHFHRGFIGQIGTVVSEKDLTLLIKFDTDFSIYLHNAGNSLNKNLYYYIRREYLDGFQTEQFKYDGLDKENWWED